VAADKIKIGVSYPTPTHAWAAGMNWHAETAEKSAWRKLYPDIDLILVNSPDPEAQASALEDLVSVHQIDALVVLPFESEPLTDPVLNVKKSGALITVVDRGLSQPGIEDLYVAGNNPELGRVSAVYMKTRLKDGDNIVVLRGIPTRDRQRALRCLHGRNRRLRHQRAGPQACQLEP
jgi:ribose transport system substrate-binding protein